MKPKYAQPTLTPLGAISMRSASVSASTPAFAHVYGAHQRRVRDRGERGDVEQVAATLGELAR